MEKIVSCTGQFDTKSEKKLLIPRFTTTNSVCKPGARLLDNENYDSVFFPIRGDSEIDLIVKFLQ